MGVAKGEGVSAGVRMGSCTHIEEELTIWGREVELDFVCMGPLTMIEVAAIEVGEEGLVFTGVEELWPPTAEEVADNVGGEGLVFAGMSFEELWPSTAAEVTAVEVGEEGLVELCPLKALTSFLAAS
jgi:hypothetical protein